MKHKVYNKKKDAPDEHLKEYLKSSYAERLNWLEEANQFAVKISKLKKKSAKIVQSKLIPPGAGR